MQMSPCIADSAARSRGSGVGGRLEGVLKLWKIAVSNRSRVAVRIVVSAQRIDAVKSGFGGDISFSGTESI